jgi:MarR family transcriptional regulator, organic hydroperoxide resistance regulator
MSEDPGFLMNDQIASSVREIWRLARVMTAKEDKVGIEQYWILRFLYESGDKRIKDIAAHLGTTSSPVTISVKRLAQGKLVTRERSKKDERVVTVALTQKGKRVFEDWRKARTKALSSLFEPLDANERNQFLSLIQKVLRNVGTRNGISS